MACDRNANLASHLAGRLSGAISRLSSKQAFVAGAASGATAAGLGALLLAQRRRLAALFRSRRPSPKARLPKPARVAKPLPGLAAGPSPPEEARPIPGLTAGQPPPQPKPIPGLRPAVPTQMTTTLQPGAVSIRRQGAAEPEAAADSYRLLNADGSDTGLALTPYQGDGEGWTITHTASGKALTRQPLSQEQAHRLADKLAGLRWKQQTVPATDVAQAKMILRTHRSER